MEKFLLAIKNAYVISSIVYGCLANITFRGGYVRLKE
jgi:hypothetical protein